MYWIYLIIFTLIVFVPTIVDKGAYIFTVVQTQEYAILILGSLGFLLFLMQERKLKKNQAEKSKYQSQVNRMSKDLTSSYSYIGEINRKLDILENITLGLPESSNLTEKKQKELYESIMNAVHIFGKTEEFAIRFVNLETMEMIKEIKSVSTASIGFTLKKYEENKNFFECDEYAVAISPRSVDKIFSYIVLKRKTAKFIEDPEILKTLAAQALFIFIFTQKKPQLNCLI